MNNTEQNLAETKAKAIIKSCKTMSHFEVARNYLENFNNKFKDKEASKRLWNIWKDSL